MMGPPFGVLVADPPWSFRDALPGKGRGAVKHYACLPLSAICAFELPPLADDALLFLWRVAALQQEALTVCDAWGFKPAAELVWCKPRIGLGHYVRNAHETCLIGTRKGSASRITARNIPSWFVAPRGRHSAKPDEFYSLIERLARGPYAEIFARRLRAGWECSGNELAGAA